jgi:DNA-binding MarR family transcriptional regulator
MHALMSVGRLMRRSAADTIDPGTFWMLKTIAAHGSMRVTELAQTANLDASTVSRHVAHLHVELSPAGQSQLDEAIRNRIALLERSLEGWGPEDLEDLGRLLNRFIGDIDTLTHDLEKA